MNSEQPLDLSIRGARSLSPLDLSIARRVSTPDDELFIDVETLSDVGSALAEVDSGNVRTLMEPRSEQIFPTVRLPSPTLVEPQDEPPVLHLPDLNPRQIGAGGILDFSALGENWTPPVYDESTQHATGSPTSTSAAYQTNSGHVNQRFVIDEFTDEPDVASGQSTEPTPCGSTSAADEGASKEKWRLQMAGRSPIRSFGRKAIHPAALHSFLQLPITLQKVKWLVMHLYSSEDRLKIWWTVRKKESWHFSIPGCSLVLGSHAKKRDAILVTVHYHHANEDTFHLIAKRSSAILGIDGYSVMVPKKDVDNIVQRPRKWTIQKKGKSDRHNNKILLVRSDIQRSTKE